MNAESWKRRTLPIRNTAASRQYEPPLESNEPNETKKPRVLTKALRSLSSSSLDSIPGPNPRSSASIRRLQKTSSTSGSVIERLQRRTSRDSAASSPIDCPGSPLDVPITSLSLLRHGQLRVDAGLLKARSEYLVLTDQCLIKFGSIDAAKSAFPEIGHSDSSGNAQTANGKLPSDIRLEVRLRSIVAAFCEEGSSPRFGIELWWCAPWPRLSYCKAHLFFSHPQERDQWLSDIRQACRARLKKAPLASVIPENLKTRVNRIVETTESVFTDGGTQNLTFPVARRVVGTPQKPNAAEDPQYLSDSSSFYLVIGPCMCYFLEVLKADYATQPGDLRVKVLYFGTVTLTRFKASVASHEQRFVISFRFPFGRETRLDLASTYYRRIIDSLTKVDRILKPMWPQYLQQSIFEVAGLPPPLHLTSGNDLGGLERSLQAYCTAFSVKVPQWIIEWNTPPQPRFRLLPSPNSAYSSLQLLAVFRALRYNSFFKSLSFRDVDLSSMTGKMDYNKYGDCIVSTSLNGWAIPEEYHDFLLQAPVLSQEMHALAFASDSIRAIDLTNVMGFRARSQRHSRMPSDFTTLIKTSSEILRPILMLLRRQLCVCNSISISHNPLSPADVDDLANLLMLEHVSIKKLVLQNCSLGDAGLTKLWSGLSGQAGVIQHLDTADNQGSVKLDILRHSLNQLRAVTKLNIAGNTRLEGDISLFDRAAINQWDLHELDISGIALNDATVDVLGGYLQTSASRNLQSISMNHCGLTARQVARLFRGMGQARKITIHINGNRLDDGIDDLCGAIACGFGPWSLFMQMIEFTQELSYVKLFRALTVNKTIECLNLAGTATPDAASDTACQAVSDFFSNNDTVRFLDISGYDAKLDDGRLGREFSKTLSGMRQNNRIEHLRVRSQMLNINIGDLAEAISGNRTLHTLDCESNDFNLSNFRHLVRNLESNTSIRHFSAFSDDELSRAVQKSVDNAGSATPPRRTSVMARLRHEKQPLTNERPLVQELRESWDTAVAAMESVLERNRRAYELADCSDSDTSSSSHGRDTGAFAASFGGLAALAYESRKAKRSLGGENATQGSSDGRLDNVGSVSAFSSDPADTVARSFSTKSSEVGGSTVTDEGSSQSAVATPPELESPTEKAFGTGSTPSPEPTWEDALESNYTFLDGHETEMGLEMKLRGRFLSDLSDHIEEEEAGEGD